MVDMVPAPAILGDDVTNAEALAFENFPDDFGLDTCEVDRIVIYRYSSFNFPLRGSSGIRDHLPALIDDLLPRDVCKVLEHLTYGDRAFRHVSKAGLRICSFRIF